MAQKFAYEPLKPNEVRLLTFHRDSPDTIEPIRCQLHTFSLDGDSIPEYQTLSYAWGEVSKDGSHFSREIICNGKTLRITENLHSALTQLLGNRPVRSEWISQWDKPVEHKSGDRFPCPMPLRPIWIDAICINQEDELEWAYQSARMTTIFRNSSRMLVWLGRSLDPEEELALSDVFDERFEENEMLYNLLAARHLKALFDRPWFVRRWSIQQVFATRLETRWIIIGSTIVKVDRLVELVKPLMLPNVEKQLRILGDDGSESKTMLENAEIYADSLCDDPRDRLFALVHISQDPYRCSPDDGKSWQEVYQSFADRHVDRSSLVRMLVSAATRRSSCDPRGADLPSWVPDWRKSAGSHSAMSNYFECPITSPSFTFDSLVEGILILEGYLLDPCNLVEPDNDCVKCRLFGADVDSPVPNGCLSLCLPGVDMFFVVRLVGDGDTDRQYTLEDCFLPMAGFWNSDLPQRLFQKPPEMYHIV